MRLLILLAAGVSLHAGTIGNNTFDSNAEGWAGLTANPFATGIPVSLSGLPLDHNAAGGNPDGYVSISDPDPGDTFFVAPSAYRGNLSAAIGGILVYDLLYDASPLTWDGPDLVIKGGGKTLIYDVPIPPIGTNWLSLAVLMQPGPEWFVGLQGIRGGSLATMQDFVDVFQNITEFWILAEFTNGISEVAGLDNVFIETLGDDPVGDPVPEPSTMSMMLAAAGAALWWRRRV
ncbi:MAG: laminin B domain-containing protein [Bryobacteraceae bacterium]|nr:laminin B domain-containing protein [Bryobacteraceae bacterium]